MAENESAIQINDESDIVDARSRGRDAAAAVGIAGADLTLVATAISEIARNILTYAGRGRVVVREVANATTRGVLIIASDDGPGIVDIERAMQDGYSTGLGLGLGLPGARRLMDEFEIESSPNGTTIRMTKWAR